MPIQVTCPSCKRSFNAPDAAAGRRAKCPKCSSPIDIPAPLAADEVLEAELDAIRPFTDEDFEVEPPAAVAVNEGGKPCPMCGETIQKNAVKCRHCGEIFDPILKAQAKKENPAGANLAQDKSNSIVIFVTSLLGCFSPIVAIYGIIFLLRRPYSFPLKWMAVVGTVLHCIWTLILLGQIALVVANS